MSDSVYRRAPLGAVLYPARANSRMIKGDASTGKIVGFIPAYSASGQDIWVPDTTAHETRPGLVLSAVGARCGKTFLANHKKWSTVANTVSWVFSPNAEPRFVHYVVNDETFWVKGGAAQPYVRVPDSLRKRIPFPDAPTQRRIADYLDRETAQIDAMAEALDGLVARLEERRTSIIEHSVTGRTGGGVQGGAGVSPTPMAPLGALCHLVAGGTPSSSDSRYWESSGEAGTPWVSIGDMSRRKWVTSTSRRVSDAGLSAARLPTAPAGTVLFAMYASVGETAILNFPASWNQALLGVAPYDDSKLSATYLYYALLTLKPELPLFYRSNTQNNLNAETVARFRIPLPDLPTQRRIADYLDRETAKIDAMIAKAGELRALLNERRSALITATVTGQHPVPEEP